MIFRTVTGSVYELDKTNKRIRRLTGVANATPRQGPDGEWKTFSGITELSVGRGVGIVWDMVNDGSDDPNQSSPLKLRTTVTSPIEEIISLADPLDMVS